MPKFRDKSTGFYTVAHYQWVCDRYQMGESIVKANSKEEAMEKLNLYIKESKSLDDPCKHISYVTPMSYIE